MPDRPPTPTSIRLFLAQGVADGLWVVEKSNWTGLGLAAPRTEFPEMRRRPELNGPGVYVLVGPAEAASKAGRVYIGETDDLRQRLDKHQSERDFWTRAIVFTAKDANLNKAHVRYLETRLIDLAQRAGRYELDNGPALKAPALSEPDQADAEAFLSDMLLIVPVIGLQAFEELEVRGPSAQFRLIGKGADATGTEVADGFVVHAGSLARPDEVPSIHAYGSELRLSLQKDGVLVPDGEHLRFTADHLFASPSTAAMVVLGRTANGRIEWKTADGRTLKDVQTEQST